MKMCAWIAAACLMLTCLSGCGQRLPAAAADGTPWSESWITLGQTVGVEEPGHGLTLQDNKAARDIYYAAWSIGDAQTYTDEEGQEKALYDAQMVFLLTDVGTAEEAQASVDEWLDMASDNYVIAGTAQQTYNGQEFTVLTYTFAEGTSSFARGASAFTTLGRFAISAEFACRDTYTEDPGEILADVLAHCHYAEQTEAAPAA